MVSKKRPPFVMTFPNPGCAGLPMLMRAVYYLRVGDWRNPMIQVENLTKSFRDLRRGQVLAVDHISFEARPGEVFGLLGPNGAGKTTAMRILCTVLRPTEGTARVAGYDVASQAAEVRRHIGFLSANTAIYDRMSAWELVEYFGLLYGMDREHLRERMEYVFTTL